MASISDWRRRLNSGLLFDEVVRKILEGDHIEELCVQAQHSWRNSFWSPAVTLIRGPVSFMPFVSDRDLLSTPSACAGSMKRRNVEMGR